MPRSNLEVADILRAHGSEYRNRHPQHVPQTQPLSILMREIVLMCALFGELSIAKRVLKYRVVNNDRQARELGVFSFVTGDLRL